MEDLEPKYELSEQGFPVQEPVPYFALMLREPNRVRLVNAGPDLVRCVQERLEQLLPIENFGYVVFKDYQLSFTGRFNIYDVVLDNRCYFAAGACKEDATLVQVGRNKHFLIRIQRFLHVQHDSLNLERIFI